MRLLVEYSHPAQVHKFKHVLRTLVEQKHEVLVLSRDKDVMLPLLNATGISHVCISRAGRGLMSMAFELLQRELRTLWHFIRFKPNLVLSAHSVAITHIAWLFRTPRIVHDDTEHAQLQQKLYMPFATYIVTSTAYSKNWGKRQIRINSLEPLAYLHPDHFTPDPDVLLQYGLHPERPYAVVRFIAWQAAHDVGLASQDVAKKRALISHLLAAGADKVVLTSESSENVDHQGIVRIRPEHLHDVLAFARLCVSEGGSVANEAAVLGVPTVLVNPLSSGMFNELKRYGLLCCSPTLDGAIQVCSELWGRTNTPALWKEARQKLLREKVNMADAFSKLLLDLGSRPRP